MKAPTIAFIALLPMLVSSGHAHVVINEIFYNGPADLEQLEFIELHNTASEAVAIGGWTFSKGLDFTFPKDATITPKGYLVLCGNLELFKEFYPKSQAFAAFEKSLDNSGETITLKDADGKKVDSVKYHDESPWDTSPDGYSASLERICPTATSAGPENWGPSILSEDYENIASGTPGGQNSIYAATLPPVIESVITNTHLLTPDSPLVVTAQVPGTNVRVELCYRFVTPGSEREESSLEMTRKNDAVYEGTIPGTTSNQIIRFRVRATNPEGDTRYFPHQNSIRPALSVFVQTDATPSEIPVAQFFNVGKDEFQNGAAYRVSHARSRGRGEFGGRGRFQESPEDLLRRETSERLTNAPLEKAWADISLLSSLSEDKFLALQPSFREAERSLNQLRADAESTPNIATFVASLDNKLTQLLTLLPNESESINRIGKAERRAGRGFPDPSEMINRFFNVEESWFHSSMLDGLNSDQLIKLAECHREALESREALASALSAPGNGDFREVIEDIQEENASLRAAISEILVADQLAKVFSEERRPPGGRGMRDRRPGPGGFGEPEVSAPLPPQGRSALIYTDPSTKVTQLFDFVNITPRKSGYKVRLHKDRPLHGITTLNVLYESDESATLNEALAYELYRKAGNATCEAGFLRLLIDGELAGYHLWFEQPNRNFLRRHDIDDKGNLYKLIWMGSHRPSKRTPKDKIPDRMDIIGKYEKKTNPHDGYEDIVSLIESLEQARGDDAEMWRVIDSNFEVEQVINYFAVNALLSHWDGFFNNYFAYHDTKGTKKWSLYPWDQDSTWSQRMGSPQDLSTMPLNYGAEGARPQGAPPQQADNDRERGGFRGFGGGRGGPMWWRDGGDLSKPLLSNPQFYERFRKRLQHLAEEVFTDAVFGKEIESIRESIAPEVKLRALTLKQDPTSAEQRFNETMDVFHEHLSLRRAWVLKELQAE